VCYTDTGGLDSVATLNAQISNCTPGQVVQLQAGSYTLNSEILIAKGVTVRGAGAGNTILTCTASWHCVQMGNFPPAPSAINISDSPLKDATTISLVSTGGLAVNDYIVVDQLNDGVEEVNTNTTDSSEECRAGANTRCLGQIVRIVAISGTTLTIDPSLHHAYASAQSPQAWKLTGMTTGAGLENLTITRTGFLGGGYDNVKMIACSGCWVKGIQSNTPDWWHVEFDRTIRSEARDSYFNDGFNHFTGGQAYGVVANLFATDNLIENNIFRQLRHSMVTKNGSAGNVFGYNYSRECYQGSDWLAPDMHSHGSHNHMNLWEGNIACRAYGDNSHGSSSYNTLYRNAILRESFPSEFPNGVTQARRAVDIEIYSHYWNVVGNVLGKSGQIWDAFDPGASRSSGSGRYVYTFGYFSDGDSTRDDAGIVTSTYRHGNFDYQSNTTIWDSATPDHTLPPSLYLTAKPAFFGALPWPPIGPDVSPVVATIPAKERYEGRIVPPGPGIPSPPTNVRIIK